MPKHNINLKTNKMMIKRNNNRVHQSTQGFNRVGYLPNRSETELGNVSLSGCVPGDPQNLNGIFSISKRKRRKQQMALALAVAGGLAIGFMLGKKKKK